jgi:uncharacterized damage-inducible protein DinB
MTSLLYDSMAHHIWATERLIDACADLTDEQLLTEVTGTYGSIMASFHHLVGSDGWYLSFFRDVPVPLADDARLPLAALRDAMTANGAAWLTVLESDPDADADLEEREDGWIFHAPVAFRIAQAVHHGTDHRSQICTILTTLGIEPPDIDVWAWGEVCGRTRAEWTGEGPPPTAG